MQLASFDSCLISDKTAVQYLSQVDRTMKNNNY